MKKTLGILALTHSVFLHAGSMGPIIEKTIVPYLQGEGSYTWNQVEGSPNGTIDKQRWGGRLSGGVMRSYNEHLLFTGEVGGGYYGGASERTPGPTSSVDGFSAPGRRASFTIDGYDVLVGAIYKLQNFSVLADIGFMAQNLSRKIIVTNTLKANNTQILPEIKVGGLYNLTNNLDIALSYMYVFGYKNYNRVTSTVDSTVIPPQVNIQGSAQEKNPALSTIFLGLRYNFA